MKNKGFTLIELLAVIVILAIIALIAVPIILNIIDDARKEGNKRSIELSNLYGLYRQDYCGCIYSYNNKLRKKQMIEN